LRVRVPSGRSDIKANLEKSKDAGFDKIVLVTTSPAAITACQKAIKKVEPGKDCKFEIMNWLDIS